MTLRCVYSMSVVSHWWRTHLLQIYGPGPKCLRLQTEDFKCSELLSFFQPLQRMSVREVLNLTVCVVCVCLNRDQILIPQIWVRTVCFNSLYFFHLNKVTPERFWSLSWADPCVLKCFYREVATSVPHAAHMLDRPSHLSWTAVTPHLLLPERVSAFHFKRSDPPHFCCWYFRQVLWTHWLPGLIVCL